MMRRAMLSMVALVALLPGALACDILRPEGKTKVERSDDNLAKIEGGWFVFGGAPLCRGDASACQTWLDRGMKDDTERLVPWRLVYLSSYHIEKREVTNAEYLECVQAGTCDYPGDAVTTGNAGSCFIQAPLVGDMLAGLFAPLCRFTRKEVALEPIRSVTWKQARKYCNWRYRDTQWEAADLPTEAMWERAAVGLAAAGVPFVQPELPGAAAAEARLDCDKVVHGVGDNECVNDTNSEAKEVYGNEAHPWKVFDESGELTRAAYGTDDGVADLAGNVAEWVLDETDAAEGNYDCKNTTPNPPQTAAPIPDMVGANYAVNADCECLSSDFYPDCADPGAYRMAAAAQPAIDTRRWTGYCNPHVGEPFNSNVDESDENAEHVYKGGSYASDRWCQLSPRARQTTRAPKEEVGFRCAVRTKDQMHEAEICESGAQAAGPPQANSAPCPSSADAGVDDASAPDAGADI